MITELFAEFALTVMISGKPNPIYNWATVRTSKPLGYISSQLGFIYLQLGYISHPNQAMSHPQKATTHPQKARSVKPQLIHTMLHPAHPQFAFSHAC
jgi:hypothetical protein